MQISINNKEGKRTQYPDSERSSPMRTLIEEAARTIGLKVISLDNDLIFRNESGDFVSFAAPDMASRISLDDPMIHLSLKRDLPHSYDSVFVGRVSEDHVDVYYLKTV